MSAAILYGVSGALSLAGGYFAAENIRETAKLNQEISDMNAEFAELDAYDAEIEGFTQEARYQKVVDQTLADQQLTFAVQDVDVSFGTAADIVAETKLVAELNKMEIEKQAQEQASGFKTQARQFRIGGALSTSQAESKASAAQFSGVTGAARNFTGYLRS